MITNLLILIGAAICAYIFASLYTYIDGKITQYQLWKQSKDELYILRCKKKFRKMQDYYYTLAINSPMELSRYLAIQALKEANKKIC